VRFLSAQVVDLVSVTHDMCVLFRPTVSGIRPDP
jgi:hypothetical protein